MPFANLAASVLSVLLTSSGVAIVIAATSIEEHVDAVIWVAGILFVILGFWLRDWKTKREVFEKMVSDKVDRNAQSIVQLEMGAKHVVKELEQLAKDSRRLHRWLYTVFPPERLPSDKERRRAESLAPPPLDGESGD